MSKEEAWEIWREIEKAEAMERLKAAAEKRKLAERGARAKWARIRSGRDRGRDEAKCEGKYARGEDLREIWEDLQESVEDGKLTEKEARAKMAAIKKKWAARGKDADRDKEKCEGRDKDKGKDKGKDKKKGKDKGKDRD